MNMILCECVHVSMVRVHVCMCVIVSMIQWCVSQVGAVSAVAWGRCSEKRLSLAFSCQCMVGWLIG